MESKHYDFNVQENNTIYLNFEVLEDNPDSTEDAIDTKKYRNEGGIWIWVGPRNLDSASGQPAYRRVDYGLANFNSWRLLTYQHILLEHINTKNKWTRICPDVYTPSGLKGNQELKNACNTSDFTFQLTLCM
ncbi:hypothetical protein JDV02_002102 [Purpureocillium takamizusanense]|uniref:Uncharacterized protein n=1 Tax=Purpureocillium takamizusanense TaxID=2060973 RepID=A0A9Q8Q8L0_9HYPO|nr:uncharacterized protein JDV02_002102 [Purpureocillium takamizusanense]UNI15578.1 hypothetical protein JDV02_002102 [Purpureocillium takamizusanense]